MEPTIYLFFDGNCLEAMTHYAETLGGEIEDVFRNADAPNAESRRLEGAEFAHIQHAVSFTQWDFNSAFEFGLSIILRGIEQLPRTRSQAVRP
jgi:uncharacterized glyoxalase superfamily protein PhnB